MPARKKKATGRFYVLILKNGADESGPRFSGDVVSMAAEEAEVLMSDHAAAWCHANGARSDEPVPHEPTPPSTADEDD